MRTWARIERDVVVEIIVLANSKDPADVFHVGFLDGTISRMLEVPGSLSPQPHERWVYDAVNDVYSPPPPPPPPPPVDPTMTAGDLAKWMLAEGKITPADVLGMPQNMRDVINAPGP